MTPKIICFFLFLFTLISCAPEKCHNKSKIDYHYVDEATIPWFGIFKEGNWWVYEEEKTGLRDSMYIQNYEHKIFGMGCEFREENTAKVVSLNMFIANNDWIYGYDIGALNTTYFKIGNFADVIYDAKIDSFFNFSFPDKKIIYLDHIKAGNNIYKEIIKIRGGNNNGVLDTLYMAKNIGVVRLVRNNQNQVFNLINYKINL